MPAIDQQTRTARPEVAELARRISLLAPSDGMFPLRVAGIDVYRSTRVGTEVTHALPQVSESRPVYIGDADPAIVDAANRLLKVITQPTDAELLASFAIDEIIVRLLRSPMGARIAHIGQAESGMQKMARAVSWLRANYKRSVDIPTLANLANVSVSSFHRHFKAVTSMSPLQYQKALRLQEARRLMLTTMLDAGSASRRVGYASASQFSREYARFFGAAPIKDIQRLREQRLSPTASSANI